MVFGELPTHAAMVAIGIPAAKHSVMNVCLVEYWGR
jgi:hypothetical protein